MDLMLLKIAAYLRLVKDNLIPPDQIRREAGELFNELGDYMAEKETDPTITWEKNVEEPMITWQKNVEEKNENV